MRKMPIRPLEVIEGEEQKFLVGVILVVLTIGEYVRPVEGIAWVNYN